jgi:hypothetical protein
MPTPHWSTLPSEADYAAARNYLTLLLTPSRADEALDLLRIAPAGEWPGEAVLRAAHLPLVRRKRSSEVAAALKRIDRGEALSPLLLVHDGRGRLEIADGYHRLCAALLTRDRVLAPGHLALVADMSAQAITARFVRPPART